MNDFDRTSRSVVINLLMRQYSLSRDDADDILQDAWVVLLDNLMVGKLTDVPEKLSAYLIKVCSNMAHQVFRKKEKAYLEVSLDDESLTAEKRAATELEAYDWAACSEVSAGEHARKLDLMHAQLSKLKGKQAELLLRSYGEESLSELAQKMGYKGLDSVKSTKARAMKQVRSGIHQQEKAFDNGPSPVDFLFLAA